MTFGEALRDIFSEDGWSLRAVTADDCKDGYRLLESNEEFLRLTEGYPLTEEDFLKNITELPPGVALESKHFFVAYRFSQPVALIDAVEGYPQDEILFLGLLVVDKSCQQQGVGSIALAKITEAAAQNGFTAIRLGCWSQNEKGMKFWQDRGFREVSCSQDRKVIILERR